MRSNNATENRAILKNMRCNSFSLKIVRGFRKIRLSRKLNIIICKLRTSLLQYINYVIHANIIRSSTMKSYQLNISTAITANNRLNHAHATPINKIKRFIVSRMTNVR